MARIDHLEPFGIELPADFAQYERLRREGWIDGSVTVEYEFDPPPELGLPYLYSSAERHASPADACFSFKAGNVGMKIGGAELVERNDVFRYGAQSTFALLVEDGEPFGNYFAMCHGQTVLTVLIGGVYFEDADLWQEFVDPALRGIETLR